MRASLALALLSFIAAPTILAYPTADGSFSRRSLATTYDDLMVREVTDAVLYELSRRGHDTHSGTAHAGVDDNSAALGGGPDSKSNLRGRNLEKAKAKLQGKPKPQSPAGGAATSSTQDDGTGAALGRRTTGNPPALQDPTLGGSLDDGIGQSPSGSPAGGHGGHGHGGHGGHPHPAGAPLQPRYYGLP